MKVEIWSDVVCPWCYIGKRRFEAALADFAHKDDVEMVWRSFELDPYAPNSDEAEPYVQMLQAKTGRSEAEVGQMLDHMTQTAAEEGLGYRFDLAKPGNSFDAHRLLHLAKKHGLQDALKERLDNATFTKGLSVSNHDELAVLAIEAGLPEGEVRATLSSEDFAEDVRTDVAQARAYRISGVPFFVVDQKFGISGAQPAAAISDVLNQAWADANPLKMTGTTNADDPNCADGSCSV